MARSYLEKDEAQLQFEENVKRLRLEVQLIAKRVENKALAEMSDEFQKAFEEGGILALPGVKKELEDFLLKSAQRQLTAAGHRIKSKP